jgi:hypothetical protein
MLVGTPMARFFCLRNPAFLIPTQLPPSFKVEVGDARPVLYSRDGRPAALPEPLSADYFLFVLPHSLIFFLFLVQGSILPLAMELEFCSF